MRAWPVAWMTAVRWRRALAAGSLLLLGATPHRPGSAGGTAGGPAGSPAVSPATSARRAPHDLHVAHTRMVVEGALVVGRVRMFRDDLQKALKKSPADDPAWRSAVATYVGQNFSVTANGTRLTAEVVDSGADMDGDQPIWWVLVQWKAAQPVKVLGLKVLLMFDTFPDQQNLVQLSKQPGDERHGLYFQAGDRSEQVLKF